MTGFVKRLQHTLIIAMLGTQVPEHHLSPDHSSATSFLLSLGGYATFSSTVLVSPPAPDPTESLEVQSGMSPTCLGAFGPGRPSCHSGAACLPWVLLSRAGSVNRSTVT